MGRKANRDSSLHLLKTKFCELQKRGNCHYGARCFYAHAVAELKEAPNLLKTSICKDFKMNGICSKEDKCVYAHDTSELKTKVSMCKWFLNGHCSHQNRCRFAHTPMELRSPSTIASDDWLDIHMIELLSDIFMASC
jgi:Zinc finger C-x8-C-x5-C-x3-H type (and similar)/RNA-binding, Nab2-type zinc finger